jgi:hypothetical protein
VLLYLITGLIVVPTLALVYVPKLAKKYLKTQTPEDVARLYAEHPLEKGWYRAARRDHKGLRLLGDFETQLEAVDRAYLGKEEAQKGGQSASFFVLDDKAQILQQVDA